MVLHDKATPYKEISLLDSVIHGLSLFMQQQAAGETSDSSCARTLPFPSVAANVMALCALSNLLANERGLRYVCGMDEGTTVPQSSNGDPLIETILDISLKGIGHEKQEVRQMSVSILYNFVLACTQASRLTLMWTRGHGEACGEIEMHPLAVQALCAALEDVETESEQKVRQRRLQVVCRVIRAYGQVASNFVQDLGFFDTFKKMLEEHKHIQPQLSTMEIAVLSELLQSSFSSA